MRSILMTWILLLSVSIARAETVTTRSLLQEMIDLHRLAEVHEPSYKIILEFLNSC